MNTPKGFTLMKVHRLVLDPNTNSPIVILQDDASGCLLPIWIGIFEAHSIAMKMESVQPPRPMTHDLLANTFEVMAGQVHRVEVVDLVDNTYFARIYFTVKEQEFTLDSRPSDAIALALRATSPIYVADHVLERSKINPADFKIREGEEGEVSEVGLTAETDMEIEPAEEAQIRKAVEDGLDEDEYTRMLKNYNPPDKNKLN
ncbi:MAG: bifunctional nuclease family protein [Deltaproteobacteria bacterium]|nr:bifunctional nuclease family protein [Deltaproteobacteria bacterium]